MSPLAVVLFALVGGLGVAGIEAAAKGEARIATASVVLILAITFGTAIAAGMGAL